MFKKRSLNFFFNHAKLAGNKHKARRIRLFSRILKTGVFFSGHQTDRLIKNLHFYLREDGFITTVASGHDAILLSLQALGIKPNSEVIFPVNSYPTAFPITLSGAKAIPVDVDKNGQMDITAMKKKITENTRAVVLVHLYGNTTDIEAVTSYLSNKNIFFIEDVAQAFGTRFKGKHVGTFGDISCFSFYPTKNLGTVGDGGAIWTKHKYLYDYIVKAKSYGEGVRYFSEFIAGHSRMPELQAGILNLYFSSIEKDFARRKNVRSYYLQGVNDVNLSSVARPLGSNANSDPVPHLFVLDVPNRDSLRKFLKKYGVESHIHYPTPIHLVPAFSFLGYKKGDFPVAEKLSERILSLPFHQGLSHKAIDYILSAVREFYRLHTRRIK
ncbi:MAG: aminotransferase class V-fold PLP-dependent enzyme [Patescibacteria group bacterium]|mgnify:CR=1 FL=1